MKITNLQKQRNALRKALIGLLSEARPEIQERGFPSPTEAMVEADRALHATATKAEDAEADCWNGLCKKAKHTRIDGYLHEPDDDTPYMVDGVRYCGRCHHCL